MGLKPPMWLRGRRRPQPKMQLTSGPAVPDGAQATYVAPKPHSEAAAIMKAARYLQRHGTQADLETALGAPAKWGSAAIIAHTLAGHIEAELGPTRHKERRRIIDYLLLRQEATAAQERREHKDKHDA